MYRDKSAATFELLSADLIAFFDLLDDGVLVIDHQDQCIYANSAAQSMAVMAGKSAAAELRNLLPQEALRLPAHARWSGDTRDIRESIALWARLYPWTSADHPGKALGRILLFRDVAESRLRQLELSQQHDELKEAFLKLESTQEQLLHSEKMASIGQLAAGIAHEINNPIGYVHSNLSTLTDYTRGLLNLIEIYDENARTTASAALESVDDLRDRLDFDFLRSDLPQLLNESKEGIERVRKIVQDLKDFSHVGRTDVWVKTDVHKKLESTINIVWNDLKYKAQITREFGQLPLIECLPSELNQVFMNLLMNAGHAIGEKGEITIKTGAAENHIWISIIDSGTGIPEDVLPRIFDPFFTTKPVGTGTGLGLSISYSIVAKHGGSIDAYNVDGAGACFTVTLPISQGRSND